MIQTQNSARPTSRLDLIISELINENEKNLSCQPLTNPYIPNSIEWIKESCYFGNQDSISAHPFELDQNQNSESLIDILASYPFPKIEIERECDPNPQVGNFFSPFDSIMTLISLSDFFHIPESTLNLVPVHCEMEPPIFYDYIPLMEKVCKHQLFGLNPIFERISALTF